MSDNKGYLFILFDMPSLNKKDKKVYLRLVKLIKAVGFVMALESTYYKFYDNLNNSVYDINKIRICLNNTGSVFAMKYTVNEFERIEYLAGRSLLKLDNNVIVY